MSASKSDLSALFDAFNRHDAAAAVSFMTDDVVFETLGGSEVYGTRIVGRDAVHDAFAGVWRDFPDAHWETTSHSIIGDLGVSEWIFRGTGKDGARIEAEGCDLFTLKDGKISMKRAFRKQRPLIPA
ncbi:MAG: nuclear transport factor 2 family protein [Geminicoccaceae bacterium]